MYYVYVLKSTVNNEVYIGYTENLKRRYSEHNAGKSKYTAPYKPWILLYYESYRSGKDARIREKRLKMHAVKAELLSRLIDSAK